MVLVNTNESKIDYETENLKHNDCIITGCLFEITNSIWCSDYQSKTNPSTKENLRHYVIMGYEDIFEIMTDQELQLHIKKA